MRLILYSKPGCHLCEGLEEKLRQVQSLPIELEIRDITTRDDWFQQFQYEIPVVMLAGQAEAGREGHLVQLPRLSPRASIAQLEQMLQKYWTDPAQ